MEYVLNEADILISKSDLQGNFTYVNSDFVRISGYAEEELLGKSQGMLRHPDIPLAVFEDFQRTMSKNLPWSGIIKNRTKNGEYFWFELTAAPIFSAGRAVGFTSIRTKASRDKIRDTEKNYKMLESPGGRVEIVQGRIIKKSFARKLFAKNSLGSISVVSCLSGLFGFVFLVELGFAMLGQERPASLVVLHVLGLIVAISIPFLYASQVVKPLQKIHRQIAAISSGNLAQPSGLAETTRMPELLSVVHALSVLQVNFRLVVAQIRETTTVVNDVAATIARDNADLSSRSESQASALEQTAASVDQLATTVEQNATHAHEAFKLASANSNAVVSGINAMREVVDTMESIKNSSRHIINFTSVINGLAFQTNVLALNAAVEASRAGAHGRGFAVVASEVRVLAQRSADAAREIGTIIKSSTETIQHGHRLVLDADRTMDGIVAGTERLSTIMNEIANASKEQSLGINQCSQAASEMEKLTQQNAQMAVSTSAASEKMQYEASKLAGLIRAFKLTANEETTTQ